jgi:hypothetical protein
MPSQEESEFDRRIVFKIPEYMPELRDELLKYPPNQRSKRMLQLACLGLMSSITSKSVGKTESPTPSKKSEKPSRAESVQQQPEQPHRSDDELGRQLGTGEVPPPPGVVTSGNLTTAPTKHQALSTPVKEVENQNEVEVAEQPMAEVEIVPESTPSGRRKNGPKWQTSMHT